MKQLTLVIRVLIVWLANTISIIIASFIFSEFHIDDFQTAFLFAALLGMLNALIWPTLMRFLLPITVFTLGFASLAISAVFLLLVAYIVPGVEITSFWAAIVISLFLSAITAIVSRILAINDDDSYYRNVLKRQMTKQSKDTVSKKPGVIFLEIDGLSAPMLKKVISEGHMPMISSLLSSKTHNLSEWETDLSAQTGACQAGILHGNNSNMPAFRWVEKKWGNKVMTSSNTDDAALIEKIQSNKKGLLAIKGASRSNMFSGDAEDFLFTASHTNEIKKLYNPILYSFFSTPYNFGRTITLFFAELILEYSSRFRQYRNKTNPRLGRDKRGGLYPFLRAFTVVLLRDMTTYALIGDVYKGNHNVIYATFVGYDEIAHHSGIDDKDIYRTLNQIDKQFARIKQAIEESDRNYRIVILSDHGQSKGATFKMRYGKTLEELIKNSLGDKGNVQSILESNEEWGHLNALLTEAVQNDQTKTRRAIRRLVRRKIYKDSVVMGPQYNDVVTTRKSVKRSTDVIIMGSGNLGLIYLTGWKSRVTYEQMNKAFPSLILPLAQHKGIGFLMVRSSKFGLLVIGKEGVHHIETGKIEGKDPLKGYGKNAKQHLLRAGKFYNAPDILVNSTYWEDKQEIAAFEELIGAHGGLGGFQTRPFVLYPKELRYPKYKVIGAEELHKVIRKWVN